jgi:hypothetical protein
MTIRGDVTVPGENLQMPELAEQFLKPDLDARLHRIESMLAIILDLLMEDDEEPREDLDGNPIPLTSHHTL